MMELTKERLKALSNRENVGAICGDEIAAMARQLLAGLEQEPVAYMYKDRLHTDARFSLHTRFGNWSQEDINEYKITEIPLYAASQLPQPAVVDEWRMMCGEWRDETVSIHDASGLIVSGISPNAAGIIIEAHNACRAAILQGAEPVPGWIPCSERMPEEIGRYWCYVEEQNSLGKSHYQWNCSWNGDRWWVESENGGRVTHWMPLQEPPKQTAES